MACEFLRQHQKHGNYPLENDKAERFNPLSTSKYLANRERNSFP